MGTAEGELQLFLSRRTARSFVGGRSRASGTRRHARHVLADSSSLDHEGGQPCVNQIGSISIEEKSL